MKRTIMFAAIVLALTGCSETGRIFGFERGGPDEFTVVQNPPLSMPPQATLRPPESGAARSNRDQSSNEARGSLLASGDKAAGSAGTLVTDNGAAPYNGGRLTSGGTGSGAYQAAQPLIGPQGIPIRYGARGQASTGEAALTQRVTAYYGVEPDVRRKVDAESGQLALEQEKFLHLVLFWKDPEPAGTVLNADAEARRLRENEALGKPVNAGEAPVIARKKSGISSMF